MLINACCIHQSSFSGNFDNRPDLSSFQSGGSAVQGATPIGGNESAQMDPLPNPKLGMAPLSSELAYSALGRPSGSGVGLNR
jgi:hypothetical protein